jgi:hypothetical protein
MNSRVDEEWTEARGHKVGGGGGYLYFFARGTIAASCCSCCSCRDLSSHAGDEDIRHFHAERAWSVTTAPRR